MRCSFVAAASRLRELPAATGDDRDDSWGSGSSRRRDSALLLSAACIVAGCSSAPPLPLPPPPLPRASTLRPLPPLASRASRLRVLGDGAASTAVMGPKCRRLPFVAMAASAAGEKGSSSARLLVECAACGANDARAARAGVPPMGATRRIETACCACSRNSGFSVEGSGAAGAARFTALIDAWSCHCMRSTPPSVPAGVAARPRGSLLSRPRVRR